MYIDSFLLGIFATLFLLETGIIILALLKHKD